MTVDGRTVPVRTARRGNGVRGHRTSVTVEGVAPGAQIVVRSAGLGAVAAQDPADRVFDLLNDAQIGYEVKRRVHEAVRRDPVGALGQAPALGVEGPLLSALTELVLATRT